MIWWKCIMLKLIQQFISQRQQSLDSTTVYDLYRRYLAEKFHYILEYLWEWELLRVAMLWFLQHTLEEEKTM